MGGILAYFFSSNEKDLPNEVTGLTKREVKAIQETWKLLKTEMAKNGKELFILLFGNHPSYQKFFKSFANVPIEELPRSDRFQAHAVTVMYALTSFIDNIETPEVLKELVFTTARNHNSRGVTETQFKDFTKLVIGALEIKSKTKLDEFTITAWTKLIQLLDETFTEGIELAKQTSN